ncbi:MAG: class I SAM-dependent RNA methyltransferase, partial [Phycisphaerae bacterium]|nr:class I SAM-dependent RNA methyltransferase [Phycisphaerae bacterium]
RPDSGPDKTRLVVHLYWKASRATLYLNTSGVKISDRSYRRMPYKAPMRESLAAATMMETGYDGTTPLLVPMCGSGTLAIEAALLATGRAPGLLRPNFGFMHIKALEKEDWESIRREIRKERKKDLAFPIIATDIAPEAIEAAKKNAMTAGVDHLIDFSVCDFADTKVPEENGIVILNPEYGQRMGEISELEKTYARIGDFFKQKCKGYTAYIFTGNLPLAKKVGLRTSRRTEFYNADIECRLLKYDMYDGTRKGDSESLPEDM